MATASWKLICAPLYVLKYTARAIALLLMLIRALLIKAWKLAIIAALAFLVTWVVLQNRYDRAHGYDYSPINGTPTYAR